MGAASEDEGFDGSNADSYAVVCDASRWEGHNPGGCGAQSGYHETEELAITAWDRRAGPGSARRRSESEQRELFEATVKAKRRATWPLLLQRDSAGEYLSDWTVAAWWGWKNATGQQTS